MYRNSGFPFMGIPNFDQKRISSTVRMDRNSGFPFMGIPNFDQERREESIIMEAWGTPQDDYQCMQYDFVLMALWCATIDTSTPNKVRINWEFSLEKPTLVTTGTGTVEIKAYNFRRSQLLSPYYEACYEDERPTIANAKPNDLTERVQVQGLEQTTQGRGDEPSRILLVTIHHMLYPITVQVLHQVFSPHGYVEKIVIFQKSAGVQPLIQFQSRQNVIVARNSLQGHNIYEGCCQLDIQFSNLEELQPNQDENICYYYWENCFSILSADEADNTKPSLFADTFGNNGGDDSETSGPVTPAEEVVDSGHSFTLSSLVEHESPQVFQL
ncbi:polypyrimidine tract-binding protein homolog 3 [Tanacetum coccineum]